MAELPLGITKDVFTNSVDGVFGRFKTSESYEINYLLTSFRCVDLLKLETAADAFDFKTMNFDELIQRDIDYGRVEKDIISNYLEKGQNRVIFFPPLLVSLMCLEDKNLITKYKQVDEAINTTDKIYKKTWDKNKFQLVLNTTDNFTGHKIECDGNDYNYYNYAATIKYNPELVKLVVIDGQHRFVAMKELINRGKKHLIESLEIPICLFFTPGALETTGSTETIKGDLRELFVTINTTSKEVSGHFIVLLNDKNISSYCVRSLADKWKNSETEPSKIHMLEWNTRENKLSSQRLKKYSITTVSILGECFSEKLFNPKTGGYTELLLKLSEAKESLEKDNNWPTYSEINEDTFDPGQVDVLKSQIDKNFTPAIDTLFSKAAPYNEMWRKFQSAVIELDKLIEKNVPGAKQFKEEYLFKFRKIRDNDQESVKDIEREFEKTFVLTEGNDVYLLNVFQQGFIRAWVCLCKHLTKEFDLSPYEVAELYTEALNKFCFDSSRMFLFWGQPYLQTLLFNGPRVLITQNTKDQWVNVILSSFIEKTTRSAFIEKLKIMKTTIDISKINKIDQRISELARTSAKGYFEALEKKTKDDIVKNWKYKDYEEQIKQFLATREGLEDDDSKQQFENKIQDLVKYKILEAKTIYSNLLSLSLSEI